MLRLLLFCHSLSVTVLLLVFRELGLQLSHWGVAWIKGCVLGGSQNEKYTRCMLVCECCMYAFNQVDGICSWCSHAKTLSIQPGSRMQMHQAQVPFPKMPTATMSREDLTSQKPSALPLDQVRAARESRVVMRVFLFPLVKGVRCLMGVGSTGRSWEVNCCSAEELGMSL